MWSSDHKRAGRFTLERATRVTSSLGAHSMGDVTGVPFAIENSLPEARVFIHCHAGLVVNNIAAVIKRTTTTVLFTHFDGHSRCVAESGDG